jgi:hypothetical protein
MNVAIKVMLPIQAAIRDTRIRSRIHQQLP